MSQLVLYTYWRSSSSYRVRFALAVKKLPFQSIPVNLREGEQHRDEHRARSPTGYVPCLFVDGRPLVESVAIIELLDELYPDPPLYPRDPWARARVRSLVEVINAGTQPMQNLAVTDRLASDPALRKEWSRHFNARGLASFERLMALHEQEGVEGRYAYGDTLTAADLFLVPQMYSAQRFGVDLSPYPRAVAAAEAALATDAAQAAIPERQPDASP
ncbi:maleylacetoacetate isomerase [Pendulispora albinea]|uniref:Maleylacetoacetate isomerase n=1 Tax=Pendulispora albinea TaxID=2741071 RepID=A0ABZ2M897_9BACT